MGHLILQGDNIDYFGFSLLGETSLAMTLDDGTSGLTLDFLVLSGTTAVTIASTGEGGFNQLPQLAETTNDLTTVTISGSEAFFLGADTGQSNSGDGVVTDIAATATSPTTIHSSLTLIDASATTSEVDIYAGATNTSDEDVFENGSSLNDNVTITYTGLVIKGGSGDNNFIENDAKNGIVTVGNGNNDMVVLGGAGAKATLGNGTGDAVCVGFSSLGTDEAPGSALSDCVKFGSAATATLVIGWGAEAVVTAGTTSIGLTKVVNAAAGMQIDFTSITTSSNIADESAAVASSTTLTAAENAAIAAMAAGPSGPGPGVAYFNYKGNEYFIATNNAETAVSTGDAIVKLVGITDIHQASNSGGDVTLA